MKLYEILFVTKLISCNNLKANGKIPFGIEKYVTFATIYRKSSKQL